MTQCNHEAFSFSNCRKRQVKGNFFGEPISSNGGSLLVREVDRRMGLTMAVARALGDQRQRGKVRHDVETMVRQRVHAIALGYEDLNDHDALRDDLVVQTACERDGVLASSSTLCRFEQRAERQWAIAIHQQLVEQFIASFAHRPRELVLDFDATDDPVHGHQPGRFFHGYYDRYCYLPLYVFCGQQLLVAYLRPSNIDASKHAWAILSLLVKRFRQAWPGVDVVVRGDSAFCRHRMLDWCERNGVRYIVGLARNAVLEREVQVACEVARDGFEATGRKCRLFTEFAYAARTWRRARRVIARVEHGPKGRNPRFIVTNLDGEANELYERVYCARGDMENPWTYCPPSYDLPTVGRFRKSGMRCWDWYARALARQARMASQVAGSARINQRRRLPSAGGGSLRASSRCFRIQPCSVDPATPVAAARSSISHSSRSWPAGDGRRSRGGGLVAIPVRRIMAVTDASVKTSCRAGFQSVAFRSSAIVRLLRPAARQLAHTTPRNSSAARATGPADGSRPGCTHRRTNAPRPRPVRCRRSP